MASESTPFSVRCIEAPKELDDQLLLKVMDCVNDAFGPSYGPLPEQISGRLEKGGQLYLIEKEDRVYGFATSVKRRLIDVCPLEGDSTEDDPLFRTEAVFLAEAGVRKEIQGQNFYKGLTHVRLFDAIQAEESTVFTTTQNPRVCAGIQSALKWYQDEGKIQDFYLLTSELKWQDGAPASQESQESRSEKINKLFGNTNIQKGDFLLLVFKLIYPSARSPL